MKRLILILNVILIASMLVSACSAIEGLGRTRVTIFVGLGTGNDPEQVKRENALVKKFNDSQQDIFVKFLIVPYEQSREKLLAMISGGTAPQLVGPLGIESAGQFLDSWEDLTPYIQRDNYDTADFYGPSVSLNTYEGRTVGLPVGLYPSFIFYNESAFDAAGVPYLTHDYNDTSWTIDKLRETAMLTTLDANGNNATSADFDPKSITQFGFDNSWDTLRGWEVMWSPANMGRPTTADYKTAAVNDPDWITGLQWYSDALWKDYFMPDNDAISQADPENGDLFAIGSDAMWMSNSWYMSESMNELGFNWNIAPVPFNAKGERVAQVDADIFGIPKDAKNKDAAWTVLKWLLEPENILELCDIYGCMPARKSTEAAYKEVLAGRYPNLDLSVYFNSPNYLDVPNHESWVPEYGVVNEALGNAQSQILTVDEEHDAAAVLTATNAEIQKILDEYWAKQ